MSLPLSDETCSWDLLLHSGAADFSAVKHDDSHHQQHHKSLPDAHWTPLNDAHEIDNPFGMELEHSHLHTHSIDPLQFPVPLLAHLRADTPASPLSSAPSSLDYSAATTDQDRDEHSQSESEASSGYSNSNSNTHEQFMVDELSASAHSSQATTPFAASPVPINTRGGLMHLPPIAEGTHQHNGQQPQANHTSMPKNYSHTSLTEDLLALGSMPPLSQVGMLLPSADLTLGGLGMGFMISPPCTSASALAPNMFSGAVPQAARASNGASEAAERPSRAKRRTRYTTAAAASAAVSASVVAKNQSPSMMCHTAPASPPLYDMPAASSLAPLTNQHSSSSARTAARTQHQQHQQQQQMSDVASGTGTASNHSSDPDEEDEEDADGLGEEDDDGDFASPSSGRRNKRKRNSGGDSGEYQGKGLDKRERNKLSASMYRKRRKLYLDSLEGKVGELDDTIANQAATIDTQHKENRQLKEQLSMLKQIMLASGLKLPAGFDAAPTDRPASTNVHAGARGRGGSHMASTLALLLAVLCCLMLSAPFGGDDGAVSVPAGRAGRRLMSFDGPHDDLSLDASFDELTLGDGTGIKLNTLLPCTDSSMGPCLRVPSSPSSATVTPSLSKSFLSDLLRQIALPFARIFGDDFVERALVALRSLTPWGGETQISTFSPQSTPTPSHLSHTSPLSQPQATPIAVR